MKRTLLLLSILVTLPGYGQVTLQNFSPGARSIARGFSGVVDSYNGTALYWNPAALDEVKHNQANIVESAGDDKCFHSG